MSSKKDTIQCFLNLKEARKAVRNLSLVMKEKFEKRNKKVIAVLGSFDTWPYMDYTSRLLAELGHAAVTSIRIYYKDENGKITDRDREKLHESILMRDSLRIMINHEAHSAIIIYSVPGAHYIETEWCYNRVQNDKNFEVVGIAFVRNIKEGNNKNCRLLEPVGSLESTWCRATARAGERTAWNCRDEEGFCPFIKQEIAKNVIEYFLQYPRMKLYALERLDVLRSLLSQIV